MKEAAAPPRLRVLLAFDVRGDVRRLQGGQGNPFASEDVVLKPVADEAEAVWIAETHLRIEQRGFHLARPVASVSGAFVVDGWAAWYRLRGEHRLHVVHGRESWHFARIFMTL